MTEVPKKKITLSGDRMKKFITISYIFALQILLPCKLMSQTDYTWWNVKHNWDGVRHWTDYMIISPEYLGPNALPVPDLYPGRIPENFYFELGAEAHLSKGDRTANLYTEWNFPLFTDRAAFQIAYRPVEVYRTDTLTRDYRRSREFHPEGISFGDVYAGTFIQVIKAHDYLPDLMVSANIKTASGTGLDAARHSDTPGYWFDATAGKQFNIQHNTLHFVSVYAKIGFYAYQTYMENIAQNDAVLYGTGFMLGFIHFRLHNQITGFAGYLNNGDHPIVYRMILESIPNSRLSFNVRFQQGLHDYSYTSLRITTIYHFNIRNN